MINGFNWFKNCMQARTYNSKVDDKTVQRYYDKWENQKLINQLKLSQDSINYCIEARDNN